MHLPKLKNRGVNTDSIISNEFTEHTPTKTTRSQILKERNTPHLKIKDTEELSLFYVFGKEIGQGGFGTVIAAKEIQNDKEWAIKIVVKSMAGVQIRFIQREIQILKIVHHPHIIHLDKVYESPRKIYMVLELCYSELLTVFNQNKPFSEETCRKIIEQILSAVCYLHKHEIVHRDLKMENILLTANPDNPDDIYYTKLTDFGLSIIKSGTGVENMLHERCGTLVYMSPEMISKDKYSQLCDVWACGVILFKLVSDRYPFYANDERQLLEVINRAQPQLPSNISGALEQLITKMLEKEPVRRLTADEALGHPWIKGDKAAQMPETILDTMNKWRSEMMLPKDNSAVDYFGNTSRTKIKKERSLVKQPVPMTVTNIKFNNQQNRVSIEQILPPVLPAMGSNDTIDQGVAVSVRPSAARGIRDLKSDKKLTKRAPSRDDKLMDKIASGRQIDKRSSVFPKADVRPSPSQAKPYTNYLRSRPSSIKPGLLEEREKPVAKTADRDAVVRDMRVPSTQNSLKPKKGSGFNSDRRS